MGIVIPKRRVITAVEMKKQLKAAMAVLSNMFPKWSNLRICLAAVCSGDPSQGLSPDLRFVPWSSDLGSEKPSGCLISGAFYTGEDMKVLYEELKRVGIDVLFKEDQPEIYIPFTDALSEKLDQHRDALQAKITDRCKDNLEHGRFCLRGC